MASRYRLLAAACAVAALALVPASTALAGTTPSPAAPTVSPNFGYSPPPTPQPAQFRNWQWDVQVSSIGGVNVNNVEGQGAIPMLAWLNTPHGPFLDTFSLLGNSVTLRHPALPFPTLNFATCTVDFVQVAPFSIVNGTGIAAGARSFNGLFTLNGLVSYPYVKKYGYRNNQVCPLRFVNPFTILFFIQRNLPVPGLPTPTFTDFAVQGDALVTLPVAPVPTPTPTTPYPTPTKTYSVSPYGSPTNS